MAFPVDEKYIKETELELKVEFPTVFKYQMINNNGGELVSDDYEFELFPFFDKSDKKRISRTCNHIGLETKNAKDWNNFPENAIAIGADGFGNLIVLLHNGNGILNEKVSFWNHETGMCEVIAENINELDE